jgi:hypothetical protein
MEEKDRKLGEESNTTMIGHLLIKDKDTGETLINQRDNFVQQNILGSDNAR